MNNTSENDAISSRNIYFFRQRQKNKVFQSVLAYFAEQAEAEGLTKKALAIRLQKDPSQITRWFSGAGNWTLDTISDLLLAMDAEMEHSIVPLDKADHGLTVVDLHKSTSAPSSATTGEELSSGVFYMDVKKPGYNCNNV